MGAVKMAIQGYTLKLHFSCYLEKCQWLYDYDLDYFC